MNEIIEASKSEFLQAKAMLEAAFAAVPDDRLNWSPSTTARTPLAQVAHSAISIECIQGNLVGDTFAEPTTADADAWHLDHEKAVTTREEALDRLNRASDAYVAWLDALDPARLDEMVRSPFDLPPAPMRIAITFPTRHTLWHVAQLDYMQTIYGDRGWRFRRAPGDQD